MNVSTDVLIAGAGLAGSVTAYGLAKRGVRVMLVDPRPEYPACFKAEKIEADQADLFRELGLMEAVLPHTGRIHEVLDSKDGRVYQVLRLEQYGICYHDMVNAVRHALPPTVNFRNTRVVDLKTSADHQVGTLADGDQVDCRLGVLASGTGGNLATRLGVRREMLRKEHSSAFGFDIARADGKRFPFDSVTYYPNGSGTRMGYLTLFIIRDIMRANLFTYRSLSEEWSRGFLRQPKEGLLGVMPALDRLIGDFQVVSRVEAARIDLYKWADQPRAGLVAMADVYQSVCPTTGTGLSKVLTDATVLCSLAPGWLASPGMGVDKTEQWYRHSKKEAADSLSLRKAEYRRRLSIDESLRWRVHRARVYFDMWRAGWTEGRRFTKKLTA